MIGRLLGERYRITGRVGKGSMGMVYRAHQEGMDRDVAVKILRQDRALDETHKARFFREARAQSLLASPHTVSVFDFGQTPDGELYLALELLEGESLGQRIARVKRFRIEDAIETTRQVLRSLAEAHGKGIIHRDLKPDNIFFQRVVGATSNGGPPAPGSGFDARHDEIVKVLDFGIAKMTPTADNPNAPNLNVVETQAGTVFGTPRYMSPEQAQGRPLDARTDLYSLGVMLYQMLAGRPPFTDTDAVVVMARHIRTMPKTLKDVAPDAGIPADLEGLVMRVLAKDPKDRPANAEAMQAELQQAREAMVLTSGVRPSVGELAPDSSPMSTDFGTRPAFVPTPEPTPALSSTASNNAVDTLESSAYEAVDPSKRSRRLGVGLVLGAAALLCIVAGARHVIGSHDTQPHVVLTTSASTGTTGPTDSATGSTTPAATDPAPTAPNPSGDPSGASPPITSVADLPVVSPDALPTASSPTGLTPPPANGGKPHGAGNGNAPAGNGHKKPHGNGPAKPGPKPGTPGYGLFE